MTLYKSYYWILLLTVFLATTTANAQAAPAKATKAAKTSSSAPVPPPDITLEPKAIDILKAACSRLAAAKSMTFTAVVSYENPSRLGAPLVYTTKSEVTVQRPDKLKVITSGDGPASEFYYDGKVMMAVEPTANLVAVADAPAQQELRDALQEITRAARSLRLLGDFLERHPESLLRGKSKEKP